MLRLDLKIGQSIQIGEHIVITLEEKSGRTAKLAIEADKSVPIVRVEPPAPAHFAARGITAK